MRVFVTGASGHVGSAVAAALARAGHEVLGLVRSDAAAQRLAAFEVVAVRGDMDEPHRWLAEVERSAAAIHCAAEYTERFHALDRRTTQALLQACRSGGRPRRFLYTSGCWVLGDTAGASAGESATVHPPSYAAPRVETEEMVLQADGRDVRTLVLRPACVYGGGGSLTGTWFQTAVDEGAAMVVGDGRQRWAMVHLDDMADLYVRALESPLGGEILHVGDRSWSTVEECARAASRAAGRGGEVRLVPVADARRTMGPVADCLAMSQHLDSSKAERLLGWRARHEGFVPEAPRLFLAWSARRNLRT